MKKIWSFVLACVLCVALAVPAFAADIDRFTDTEGLLFESESEELNDKLDTLSEQLQFDVAIVVIDALDGWEAEEAAESIYDQYNFGYGAERDGVILLIAMDSRDWAIKAMGFGEVALDADAIADLVVPMLSFGEYDEAFHVFADSCEEMVTNARNGNTMGGDAMGGDTVSGEPYKFPFDVVKSLVIAFVISMVVALIVVGSMKGKLKSVHQKYAASDYIVPGSLAITNARERYLYSTMSRTAKPKDNSSSSRGGGSSSAHGKF